MQTDDTVIYVTRKNPKLKEGAVPSIFPVKKIPYFKQIQHNDRHSDDVISHEKFSTEGETSETVLNLAKEPIAPMSQMLNETLQIKNRSFTPLTETIQKFSNENINIAKNIKVPTCYWFTNISDTFMMWTCWSNDLLYILRRVIITINMEVKVNIIKITIYVII